MELNKVRVGVIIGNASFRDGGTLHYLLQGSLVVFIKYDEVFHCFFVEGEREGIGGCIQQHVEAKHIEWFSEL